jgi:hypothetical protein
VSVPTPEQEQKRALARQRDQLRRKRLSLARLSLLERGNSRKWLINRNPIQKVCTKSARVSL